MTDIEKLTDDQISAIYRSTFPRGPYLITPDVHKFARAVIAEVERLRAELAAGAAAGGNTSDSAVLEAMRPHMFEADGGYACDIFPELVVKAGRAAIGAAGTVKDAERWRDLLRCVMNEMPNKWSRADGNAPGHGHSIPGIWDSDNGEKAGKECAWCKVWNAAKTELDAIEAHNKAGKDQG